MCADQLFMLSRRLLVNNRPLVLKFGGSQKLIWIFDGMEGQHPNSFIVHKSAVLVEVLYNEKCL